MKVFIGVILLLTAMTSFAALSQTNLAGDWQSVGAHNKVNGIVHISESDGKLTGAITKLLGVDHDKTICDTCSGDNHDKPLVGMNVLWCHDQAADGTWKKCEIYSPTKDKTLDCSVALDNDGQSLDIDLDLGFYMHHTVKWHRAVS